jgi:hypothetical protein
VIARLLRRCGAVASLVLLAACTNAPSQSAWGEIHSIAQAEQSAAPALWLSETMLHAVWIGADERGVHQNARTLGQVNSDVITLPLPPVHPHSQTLLPAAAGNAHLLWLDADESGETRLYSALVNTSMAILRGPTVISTAATYRYIALPQPNGGLTVIWSGGHAAEPALYAQTVDFESRPNNPRRLISDADYPMLLRGEDGTYRLLWLAPRTQRIFEATLLANGALLPPTAILTQVRIGNGDWLMNMGAQQDATHTYIFWNILRADGAHETWYARGADSGGAWSQPAPLLIDLTSNAPYESGYNGGGAQAAQAGATPIIHTSTLAEASERLVIAAQINGGLHLVYFESGDIRGQQRVVADAPILAPPLLMADANRDFILAWAQPNLGEPASLLYTSTRRP